MGASFFDGVCEHCGGPVSWAGYADQRPDCPNCGKPPSPETKIQEAGVIQDLNVHVTKDAHFESGASLRVAREYAGLSLGQAADVLKVRKDYLKKIEMDIERVTPKLADAMNHAYGMKR